MKQLKLLGMGLLMGTLFVGCSSANTESTTEAVVEATGTETSTNEASNVTGAEQGEDEGIEVQFVLNHTEDLAERGYAPITLDEVPERIVLMSTSPFHTLHNLGITDHIVAVPTSTSANYPEELAAEVLPAAMGTIDVEKIISLNPDLVILPETSMAVEGETLKNSGINVYAVSMYDMSEEKNTYEYTKEQTQVLIEAFAKTEEEIEAGKEILGEFTKLEQRMESFKANNASKTYLSTMVVSDTDSYANTTSSVIGVMLDLLGYENLYENIAEVDQAAGHASAPVNLEDIVGVETDLFVFLTRDGSEEDARNTIQSMIDNNPKVWEAVPAVESGNYIVLPSKYFVSVGILMVDNINGLMDILE